VTRLEGERVVLRPFEPAETDAVIAAWQAWDDQTGHPRSAPDREQVGRRLAGSGSFVDGRLEFAIEAEGRLVGDVQARAPDGAFPPSVYELGITIHHAADRGQGYGTEAISLLTQHLFGEHGAERIQASTALWNEPSRRAFARAGFREEGVMRAFMPASGERDDYVLMAITRADGAGVRGAALTDPPPRART
jgi:RimJ/RimL family protein N-acetyltransferase